MPNQTPQDARYNRFVGFANDFEPRFRRLFKEAQT